MISYFRPESRDDLTWSVLFFLVTLSDCQVPLGGRLHLVLTTTRCDEMGQFSICFLVYYPCFNTSYAILFDFLRSYLVISIEKETWLFLVPDIPSLDFRHIKKKKNGTKNIIGVLVNCGLQQGDFHRWHLSILWFIRGQPFGLVWCHRASSVGSFVLASACLLVSIFVLIKTFMGNLVS